MVKLQLSLSAVTTNVSKVSFDGDTATARLGKAKELVTSKGGKILYDQTTDGPGFV
jgi:hypothetical protein